MNDGRQRHLFEELINFGCHDRSQIVEITKRKYSLQYLASSLRKALHSCRRLPALVSADRLCRYFLSILILRTNNSRLNCKTFAEYDPKELTFKIDYFTFTQTQTACITFPVLAQILNFTDLSLTWRNFITLCTFRESADSKKKIHDRQPQPWFELFKKIIKTVCPASISLQ